MRHNEPTGSGPDTQKKEVPERFGPLLVHISPPADWFPSLCYQTTEFYDVLMRKNVILSESLRFFKAVTYVTLAQ